MIKNIKKKKKTVKKYFRENFLENWKCHRKMFDVFKFLLKSWIFENFDNFKLKQYQAPGLSENVSTGFGQL